MLRKGIRGRTTGCNPFLPQRHSSKCTREEKSAMCMLGCVVLRAWTDVAIARSLRPRFPQVPLPFVLPKRRHVAGRVGLQHRGASIESLGEVTWGCSRELLLTSHVFFPHRTVGGRQKTAKFLISRWGWGSAVCTDRTRTKGRRAPCGQRRSLYAISGSIARIALPSSLCRLLARLARGRVVAPHAIGTRCIYGAEAVVQNSSSSRDEQRGHGFEPRAASVAALTQPLARHQERKA